MIIAVVGLGREARIVASPNIVVSRRGANLSALAAKGAEGIISVGIAAGLDPALKVGDCVIASHIKVDSATFAANEAWIKELSARLPEARVGVVAGCDAALATSEQKSTLHTRLSALAADMESHAAARAAAKANIPFAAVRIISDEAAEALPPAAVVAMRADGSIDMVAVIGSLIVKPAQIPALVRTAQNAEIAFGALLRCRSALGPRLAFPDLG